jgi:hypothetical protein
MGVWRAALWLPLVAVISLLLSGSVKAQTSCGVLSQCPYASTPLNGGELLYIVQGGLSKKITTSDFAGVMNSILGLNNTFTGIDTFTQNPIFSSCPLGDIVLGGGANQLTCAPLMVTLTYPLGQGTFVPLTPTYEPAPTPSAASWVSVLGSVATPDTSGNATAIFQKIGTASANLQLNTTVYASLIDEGPTGANPHGTGITGSAQTGVAYISTGPFFEGIRGDCTLLATSTNGQCNAESTLVAYYTTNHAFAIGIESDVANMTGVDDTIDAYQNAAFVASTAPFGTATHKVGGAYVINPYEASGGQFIYGFWIPPGTAEIASVDIELQNTAPIGLDMRASTFSYPIALANNTGVFFNNHNGNTLLEGMFVNTFNQLVVGNDSALASMILGASGVSTTILGSLTLSGLASGTASQYLCLTSSNIVIAQAGAC